MSDQSKQQAFADLAFMQTLDVDLQGFLDSQEDEMPDSDRGFTLLSCRLDGFCSPGPRALSPMPFTTTVTTFDAGDLTILKNAFGLLQQDGVKLVLA